MSRRLELWVVSAAVLVFFAQTSTFHLMFDGLTYAALAKNILRSGDWSRLHYGLEQYPDFFQHPPLAIWIQAAVFKLFGFSEAVSRVFPASLAVLSAWMLFAYTKHIAGRSAGLFAALVLISSTRFVKWASNFYLDGILSFFGLGAAILMSLASASEVRSTRRSRALMILGGASLSCAFMVKGVAALPAAGACGLVLLFHMDRRFLIHVLLAIIGMAFPLMIWFGLGDGLDFLERYFAISVAGRASFQQLSIHPWRNLYALWLPWFPIFVWGLIFGFKAWSKREPVGRELVMWSLAALAVPLAYSFGVVYMEHYLTPFYPLAAIPTGVMLSRWFPAFAEKAEKWMWGGLFVSALLLATFAPDVNQQKRHPADFWLASVNSLKVNSRSRIDKIVFTEKAGGLWLNLAILLARGEDQAIGSFDPLRQPQAGMLMVASPGEVPSANWGEVSCLRTPEFRFYSSRNENYCE